MTAPTTANPTAPAEPKPARAALVWKGTREAWGRYRRWRTGARYTEYAALAKLDKNHAHVAYWEKTLARAVADNAQTTGNVVRTVAAALAGGWWPAVVVSLAGVVYQWQVLDTAKDIESKARERSGMKAAWTSLAVAVALLAVTVLAGGAHVGYGPGNALLTGLVVVALAAGFLRAVWDGDAGNDLPQQHVEPPQVDEVKPDISTNGGVVAALAGPLGVKKAADVKATFTVVGPGLTWDAAHRWKTITIQMRGKTVMQLQDEKVRHGVAGNLQVPADWLLIDTGANASQPVLHMAETSPWPTEPTPAPMLDTLSGDVWRPQRVGLDMLGSTPVEMTFAASSIGIGGNTGTGKTALERLAAFLILADRYALLDLWDFKGDGALSMFEPYVGTYRSGDAEDLAAEFAQYLAAVDRDRQRRAAFLAKLAAKDRVSVRDAKVTRELAHRYPQLRPRFVMVDEFQDALADPACGKEILRLLLRIGRKGRSAGVWLILASQNWPKETVPTELTKVLPTRISLRMPDYASSAQILGGRSCKYRADLLPEEVRGGAIIHPAGDGAAVKRSVRVMLDYADALDTEQALERLAEHRGAPVELPPCPPVLATMHDILSAPERDGRLRSVEMAAALCRYGFLPELSDELDVRGRAQLLADMLRPLGVRPRPDRANGNALTYWLAKVDTRRDEEVGVAAARGRYGPVGTSGGASGAGDAVSPMVLPGVIPIRRSAHGA